MKELKEIKGRYDFSLDNRQLGMIISGIILVMMLSFLMGALFGHNLNGMEGGAVELAEADAPEAADLAGGDDYAELADDEGESSLSREEYIRELENLKVPSEVAEADDEDEAFDDPADVIRELAKADQPADQPAKQPTKSKPDRKVEKPKRTFTPSGDYTIQLASFPERGEAVRLVQGLKTKMYDAYLLEVTLPGKGLYYRVRIGRYESLAQAKKALAILQGREGRFHDAWITQ